MNETVEDLRAKIVKAGLANEEEVKSIKGKAALLDLLGQNSVSIGKGCHSCTIEQAIESAEPIMSTSNEDLVQEVIVPEYGSDDWQDFLLSQLKPKEKDNNMPKCAGLRRLAEKFLGDIIESGPTQVFAPTSEESSGRATVVWSVKILWKLGMPEYYDINKVDFFTRTFSDVADCWIGNTPNTYAVHPSSTAATRAEGRALKKALMLNIFTAEEMNNDKSAEVVVERQMDKIMGKEVEWSGDDKISASQKNFVIKKCESMNIDVAKFINKSHHVYGEEKRYNSIEEVSRGVAAAMIEELNKYQNESNNPLESKTIPQQIKV